ncbi:MAG: alkaline phosphatase family protein [Planctomycetota bacterium]|jgi:hypothetical protein
MNRRTLLKTGLASLAALASLKPLKLWARAPRKNSATYRVVVFGSDALRIDTAEQLRLAGAPGLSKLNPPITALSGGGFSVTQPGWASIWSGLPSWFHKSFSNGEFSQMPPKHHIMERLFYAFWGFDFFPVWITGKEKYLTGNIPRSPHYPVYKYVNLYGLPGVYQGDKGRDNFEVYELATTAFLEALDHEHFCCFIHFQDPDYTGHLEKSYSKYYAKAEEVDQYIGQLISMLPSDVDIIYCSDHGFNFVELGAVENNHHYAPKGMVATNFPINPATHCTRESIGRLIYRRMGGNPDYCDAPDHDYAMYGIDL